MKYSVITFGCRVNQADASNIEESFRARGAIAADAAEADIVVVNTCSVTASADQAARQTIRRVSRINPAADIVVTGCYATRRPDEVAGLPNVLCVIPNDDKPRTIPLIFADLISNGRVIRLEPELTTADRFGDGHGSCGAVLEPGIGGRTAFTLRVQTGCGEQCSYCIIPTTRGRPRSLSIQEVVAEIRRVTAARFKEIVVTGVHLGSYGRDLSPRSSLSGLLDALRDCAIEGETLLRISSLEPMDCTPEIVNLVATAEQFAPHFHLPLQHASNRMLRAMRRPYTIEYYRGLVDDIRSRMPQAAIGSDIIVGFPGESEDDFRETLSLVEAVAFDDAFTFRYSPREGTPATRLKDVVPDPVAGERLERLVAAVRGIARRKNVALVGSTHEVLVEGWAKRGDLLQGRTRANKVALFPGPDQWIGSYRMVRFTGTTGSTFAARTVGQELAVVG